MAAAAVVSKIESMTRFSPRYIKAIAARLALQARHGALHAPRRKELHECVLPRAEHLGLIVVRVQLDGAAEGAGDKGCDDDRLHGEFNLGGGVSQFRAARKLIRYSIRRHASCII